MVYRKGFEREGVTGLLAMKHLDLQSYLQLHGWTIREAGIIRRFSQYIINLAGRSSKALGKLTALKWACLSGAATTG
jgi:hypothetical protein